MTENIGIYILYLIKQLLGSVEVANDNRIYVGGQDEIGYFIPGKNGRLEYHSLKSIIPEKNKSFGDVWDIVSLNNDIFFRTSYPFFNFQTKMLPLSLRKKNGSILAR